MSRSVIIPLMPVFFRRLAHNLARDFAKSSAAAEAPKPLKKLSESVDLATSSLLEALHKKNPPLQNLRENFAELCVSILKFLKDLGPQKLKPITAFLERLFKTKTRIQENLKNIAARKQAQVLQDINYWKNIFPFDRLDSQLPENHKKIAAAVDETLPKNLRLTPNERNALVTFCLLHKEFGVEEIKTVTGLSQSSAYRYKTDFDNNNFDGPLTDVKAKWFMLEKQDDYKNISDLAKAVRSFFNIGQATVYRWIRENQDAFPKFPPPKAQA